MAKGSKVVQVRMAADLLGVVEAAAGAAGVSVPEWCRRACLAAASGEAVGVPAAPGPRAVREGEFNEFGERIADLHLVERERMASLPPEIQARRAANRRRSAMFAAGIAASHEGDVPGDAA